MILNAALMNYYMNINYLKKYLQRFINNKVQKKRNTLRLKSMPHVKSDWKIFCCDS